MLWQPTLSSDLVTLRPLLQEDWPALLAAASDPAIWALHPEPTRWQPEPFAKFFAAALASHGALAVLDARSGAMIGSSRYTNHRDDTRSVEIGYTFLACSHWGGAVNASVKALMLEHAFQHVDSVWFVVGESNWRSRRAMEKIGGSSAPTANAPVEAKLEGRVLYRIDRASWRNPRLE